MKKIVLTGGPCAGKTTVLKAIKKIFGSEVLVVDEVATQLFSEGYPAPNPWSEEWQNAFQDAVIERQDMEEIRALENAQKNGCKIIIFDRGLLDGAAYVEGGVEEFCRLYNVAHKDALMRYDVVLHLESLATLDPKQFEKLVGTNPHRYEALDLAQKREFAMREVWAAHQKRIFLSGHIEDSALAILDLLDTYLK